MYSDKKVLVVGIARSGVGAANLLCSLGANVTINDIKNKEQLSEQLEQLDKKIKIVLECKADDLITGKDIVVVSPGIPTSLSLFEKAKAENIPVIGEVELAYSVCMSQIAAITGTNGKTTTTALVGAIFNRAKKDTFIVGNIGDAFSNKVMDMDKNSAIALEVSSFQLETIVTFRPEIAAVLNITLDHIARHGSMDEYIRCKERIFENQTTDDILVLNYDDATTKAMASKAVARIIYFSKDDIDEDCVCIVDGKIVIKDNNSLNEVCDAKMVSLQGVHNLENVLAAVAITYFHGIQIADIAFAIQSFAGVEHRLEFVCERSGVRYINDSKGTNTDASIWAIKAMGRPTIIILGGYDKRVEFDTLIESFTEHIVEAIVIGETKEQLINTLDKYGFSAYHACSSFDGAVQLAIKNAKAGYNVLLSPACASFDMFVDFEARGLEFKKIVNSIQEA